MGSETNVTIGFVNDSHNVERTFQHLRSLDRIHRMVTSLTLLQDPVVAYCFVLVFAYNLLCVLV